MSRKGSNNHYHYAEKFESRAYQRRVRAARILHTPRKSMLFALAILCVFGFISTTFAYYVSDVETTPGSDGSVIVSVRTALAQKDESAGALAEERGIDTSAAIEPAEASAPVNVYSRDKDTDLVDTAVNRDLAATGTTWHDDWRDTGSNSTATIYYDNSITRWSSVNFKIGRNWSYGSDSQGYSILSMSLVTGTNYIYKVTIDWGKYNDFYFVNGGTTGWHGNSSVRNHDSQYTAFTTPKSFALGSSTYFFIGQSSSIGSTSSPTEVTCFGAGGNSGDTTASHYTTYQKSVSVASVANGTVVATYKNDSGTNINIQEGSSATILIGKTITVTETANTNYAAGDITVTYANNASSVTLSSGGSTFTSGSTATTITGSFHVDLPDAATSVSLSASPSSGSIYSNETSVTYTATATGAASGVTYNFKIDGTSVQNTTSNTYTTAYASAGTYSITVTVEKSGYDSVSSSAVTTTVTDRPAVYFKKSQSSGNAAHYADGTQMTYDPSTSKYKLTVSLDKGNSGNWYYIVIYDASESNNLSYNGGTLTETPHTGSGFIIYSGDNNVDNPLHIVASVTGDYIFYFDAVNNKLFVECPHTVTFNANGHGTAPAAQVVTYGSTASNPGTLSVTGYTHDGSWYTTSACTTAWNFSSAITEDKILYAKWTANPYSITYLDQGGTTFSGTHAASYPTTHTYGTATSLDSPTKVGYNFGGYFTNSSCTGTAVTSLSASGYTANITLYAKWTEKTYTVTYNKGTASGVSGNNTSATKYHFSNLTLLGATFTRSGYTQAGWSTTDGATSNTYALGASYSSNTAVTLYPTWNISSPSLTFADQSFTLGDEPLNLSYSVTTNASGVTPTATFSITSYPNGGSGTTIVYDSSTDEYVLTNAVPGTYTVQLTGTATASSVNGSATASTTATITVYPAVPDITLSINGYSATATSGDDTVYIVMLGSEYYFEAYLSGADLDTVVNADYTYTWYVGSQGTGNELTTVYSGDCTANSNGSYVKFGTATANVADTVNQTLTLVCVASRNSVTNTNTVSLLYMKKNLIDSFELDPFQKIYNVSSSVSITADYDDTFEGGSATGYTTTVYFSPDNNAYYYAPAAVVSDTFMTSFTSTLNAYVYPAGVKYIYMNITNGTVSASTTPVHTTVGTANTAASRPFYFINNSGMNLSGYRVMAFWTNSDDTTGFQTAQPISDGVRYRVNIPTTATSIAFGAAIGNRYSGTPSMSNDAFIFSTDFFEACTATVSIDATVNTLSASGYDSSSPPILTTSTGTFVPQS